MKTDRRALHGALKELLRLVPRQATLPVLEMVHLAAHDGTLTLTTTDLSRRLSCQLPAESDINICIQAKPLAGIIKPECRRAVGVVDIIQDDDKVHVHVDGLTSHHRTTPAIDFPVGPSLKKDEPWNLLGMWPSAPLTDALTFVLPAASKDESRPHLCTVLLQDQDVVTTDGHRLHRAPLPSSVPHPLLLPAAAAASLCRILTPGEQVILAQAGNVLRVKVGNWQLDTRLSDQKFPLS